MTDGPKPWYDLREYAAMTEQTYTAIRRRADRGTLKTGRLGKNGRGKRVIFLATLRADCPDLYASLVEAARLRGRK